MALHELGHAAGLVATGGQLASISLNPFCWCWARYASNPQPMITAWSGVVGGVLFSLLPYIVFRIVRLPMPRLAIVLAIVAMARDGVYLLGGTLANVGDGAAIVRLGAPRFLPIGFAVLLLAIATMWFVLAQDRIGIPHSASLAKRTTIVLGGIGSYLVIGFAYVAAFHRHELVTFAVFSGAGILLLVVLSIAATFAPRYAPRLFPESSIPEISWPFAIGHLVIGTIVVCLEIAVFGV